MGTAGRPSTTELDAREDYASALLNLRESCQRAGATFIVTLQHLAEWASKRPPHVLIAIEEHGLGPVLRGVLMNTQKAHPIPATSGPPAPFKTEPTPAVKAKPASGVAIEEGMPPPPSARGQGGVLEAQILKLEPRDPDQPGRFVRVVADGPIKASTVATVVGKLRRELGLNLRQYKIACGDIIVVRDPGKAVIRKREKWS